MNIEPPSEEELYEELLSLHFWRAAKVCQCCSLELTEFLLTKLREAATPISDREEAYTPTVADELAAVILEIADLVQHDSGVRDSWITEKGEKMLADIDAGRMPGEDA